MNGSVYVLTACILSVTLFKYMGLLGGMMFGFYMCSDMRLSHSLIMKDLSLHFRKKNGGVGNGGAFHYVSLYLQTKHRFTTLAVPSSLTLQLGEPCNQSPNSTATSQPLPLAGAYDGWASRRHLEATAEMPVLAPPSLWRAGWGGTGWGSETAPDLAFLVTI